MHSNVKRLSMLMCRDPVQVDELHSDWARGERTPEKKCIKESTYSGNSLVHAMFNVLSPLLIKKEIKDVAVPVQMYSIQNMIQSLIQT